MGIAASQTVANATSNFHQHFVMQILQDIKNSKQLPEPMIHVSQNEYPKLLEE